MRYRRAGLIGLLAVALALCGCTINTSQAGDRAMDALAATVYFMNKLIEENIDQLSDDPTAPDGDALRVNLVLDSDAAAISDFHWGTTLYAFDRPNDTFRASFLTTGGGSDSIGPVSSSVVVYACVEISGTVDTPSSEWRLTDLKCPAWLAEGYLRAHPEAWLRSFEESLELSDLK